MKKLRFVLLLLICLLVCACGKKVETTMIKYCERGELDGDRCRIYASSDPVSVTCDEGLTFNEETKKCESYIAVAAERTFGCLDEGYKHINGKCINDAGDVKYHSYIFACPEGLRLDGEQCLIVTQTNPGILCEETFNANLEEVSCTKVEYEPYKEKEVEIEE